MAEEFDPNQNGDGGSGEKTFTQAELDRIVSQRVARATKGMPTEDEMRAFNAWKANQQSEADKYKELETKFNDEVKARKEAEEKLTRKEREAYLSSKGVSADDMDYYCFTIGKKVTDTVTFEKAADEFFKNKKPAGVRVDMSAHVGGNGNGGGKTANDIMNALIRGKF